MINRPDLAPAGATGVGGSVIWLPLAGAMTSPITSFPVLVP